MNQEDTSNGKLDSMFLVPSLNGKYWVHCPLQSGHIENVWWVWKQNISLEWCLLQINSLIATTVWQFSLLPANASVNFTDESLGDFLPGEIQTQVRKQEIISVGPHIIESESLDIVWWVLEKSKLFSAKTILISFPKKFYCWLKGFMMKIWFILPKSNIKYVKPKVK